MMTTMMMAMMMMMMMMVVVVVMMMSFCVWCLVSRWQGRKGKYFYNSGIASAKDLAWTGTVRVWLAQDADRGNLVCLRWNCKSTVCYLLTNTV